MNPTINPQATGLQVFYNENENVSIRTEMKDGEPWFVARDIASALDITWTGHILDRIPKEWTLMVNLPINGSEGGVSNIRRMILINESAMYKLAFRSNKPEADRFVNWIAGDVLPSIRRTGSYSSTGLRPAGQPERMKLPLPKHRPFFENWQGCVKPYLSDMDAYDVADRLDVSYSHVRKVFKGTAVSEPVARALTEKAMENKRRGVKYEEVKPVFEQLSIEWERKETKC